MNSIRVHRTGGPEVLSYEETPTPRVEPGKVLVKIEYSGLNFIDTYYRTGLYKTQVPYTPGQEAAGVVAEVGSGVKDFKPGDPVAYTGILGTYAEYALVPAARLLNRPLALDARTAAASLLQGLTAHYLTHTTYPLKRGETCLVHAAAGGMGLLLCQVARMIGATVIGTVSTPEKEKLAREAGADHVVRYTEQDFLEEVRRITEGKGVHVVYDGVGQSTFEKGIHALRPRGMMVLFGQSSGPVTNFDPSLLSIRGSLFLTRPGLSWYISTREELTMRAEALFDWILKRGLKIRIDREFPLRDAAEAHRAIESRGTAGKVLLRP